MGKDSLLVLGVLLLRRGAGQRRTVTQEAAEGISNKSLTSQFCCGLPSAWPCL